jgi:glutamate carboxypeptidase
MILPRPANSFPPFDLGAYAADLEALVNIDSGSYCLPGLTVIADWFADRFAAMGWRTEVVELQAGRYGRSLYATNSEEQRLDLLILSHSDTVFPAGTVAVRPFFRGANRYYGPGVADMKAGALMALYALEQLERAGVLTGNIGFFLNAEEEISCPTTRPFIEEKSRRAQVVVSTEPARANGACVRQRKGVHRYTLRFRGKSAHSGVDAASGACAVTEMARMIVALKRLEDPALGITVNPGLVRGGISVNSVPDYAECEVDMRVTDYGEALRLHAMVQDLATKPEDPRVSIELAGGITRPPMLPTRRGDELIEMINGIGREHGLAMSWTFSGGGSDACFASAFGKPVLCGLGPVGGAYHTADEYLETGDLQQRLCVFRDAVARIANGEV